MQRDTSSSDASASHTGRVRRRRQPSEVSNFFFLLFITFCFQNIFQIILTLLHGTKLDYQPVSGALFRN